MADDAKSVGGDDAGAVLDEDAGASGPRDGGTAEPPDAAGAEDADVDDAGEAPATTDALASQRDRLLVSTGGDPCGLWAGWDQSTRAVFLTITHRLFVSKTPDGASALSHVERLHGVLGGGPDGDECGGIDNNRVFASMDEYLWRRMLDAHDGALGITDGSDGYWARTRDIAGPHAPFDASNETQAGVDCILLIETDESRAPTGQAHFFRPGSAAAMTRGTVEVPLDPRALEIDLDYDCLHRSNPTCRDFESRYREGYGDFVCDWVPSSCAPAGAGCYRGVMPR